MMSAGALLAIGALMGICARLEGKSEKPSVVLIVTFALSAAFWLSLGVVSLLT